MGSTPEAARPSGHGVDGGADRAVRAFGFGKRGKLVWCKRSFGFASAGLRPPDFRCGFGRDGERAGSLEPVGAFGFRQGERAVRSTGTFGFTASGLMSESRGSSEPRDEGRTSHPTELRLRRIERAFGSRGRCFRVSNGRMRTDVRHEEASVSEGRMSDRLGRTFGKSRAGAARLEGASAPAGRATVRLEGASVPESGATVRLEGCFGARTSASAFGRVLRCSRVERPFGSLELRLQRDGRQRFSPTGLRLRRKSSRRPGTRRFRSPRVRAGTGCRDGDEQGPTPRGDRRRRRRTATQREQSSEGCNPMSGSGMK
jgi:hypothetical protein